MFAFQWKSGLRMVEIGHPVDSIVADQTIFTIIQDMLSYESDILRAVALSAALGLKGEFTLEIVTGMAAHWLRDVIHLVRVKAEARPGVIEHLQAWVEQVEISSLMFAMAAIAVMDLGDQAMGTLLETDLIGHGGVAGEAELILGGGQWGMTEATLVLKAGM